GLSLGERSSRWAGEVTDLRGMLCLIFARLSVFSAVSISFGAAAGLCSYFFDASPWLFFTFGSMLPIGPMTIYFSSARALRRGILYWQSLYSDNVMVQRELEFASVGVSGNTPHGGPFHEHHTQALLGP